jgi:hypothetical protein
MPIKRFIVEIDLDADEPDDAEMIRSVILDGLGFPLYFEDHPEMLIVRREDSK